MRTAFAIASALLVTLSSATLAQENEPPKNEFGQARSQDARETYNPSTGYDGNIGRDFFSERKGANAEMNTDYPGHPSRGEPQVYEKNPNQSN
jgi:hypothetical protein